MIGPDKIIAEFPRFEKTIYDYWRDRVDNYFASRCYSILCNRMNRLDDSVDMKPGKEKNTWNSKFRIPYGHESYVMTRASLKRAFAAEPLASLQPINQTAWQNAIDMQDTLNQNYKSTRFRDLAFDTIIKTTARYGSCPVVSHFEHRPRTVKRTMNGPFGIEQAMMTENKHNVINFPIDLRNYFQNPVIPNPEDSDFIGYIQRWNVSSLIGVVESMKDLYIKKNIAKVINEAKESAQKNEHFHENKKKDYHGHTTDIEHGFIKLNFEDNEEDETLYYIEVAGDKIIRIQDNPNDYGITSLSVFGLDKRTEFWWSNTPIEKTIPIENYASILLEMTADNLFRASQNYVFFPKGSIDPAAINDRHKNGGFIPVDSDVLSTYKTPLFPWQRQELSTGAVQYMMGEMKEALSRTQAKPDIQRQGVQGGPQNGTATAFQGMQDVSTAIQFDYLSEFGIGIKDISRVNAIMLQQRLPDWFEVRPNPKEMGRVLHKTNILGDYAYQVESAMTKNTQADLMKFQNALTWIMNMAGTGRPELQRVNVEKIFRAGLKKFDLDVDMDEVYPEQPEGQPGQPGAQVAVPAQIVGPQAPAMAAPAMAGAA